MEHVQSYFDCNYSFRFSFNLCLFMARFFFGKRIQARFIKDNKYNLFLCVHIEMTLFAIVIVSVL